MTIFIMKAVAYVLAFKMMAAMFGLVVAFILVGMMLQEESTK